MQRSRLKNLLPNKPDGVDDTVFLAAVADFILGKLNESELGSELGLNEVDMRAFIRDCKLYSKRSKQRKNKLP